MYKFIATHFETNLHAYNLQFYILYRTALNIIDWQKEQCNNYNYFLISSKNHNSTKNNYDLVAGSK